MTVLPKKNETWETRKDVRQGTVRQKRGQGDGSPVFKTGDGSVS